MSETLSYPKFRLISYQQCTQYDLRTHNDFRTHNIETTQKECEQCRVAWQISIAARRFKPKQEQRLPLMSRLAVGIEPPGGFYCDEDMTTSLEAPLRRITRSMSRGESSIPSPLSLFCITLV